MPNQTEIGVQVKGVHLCCGGCVDAVATAVASVPGVAFQCDMENGTVALTAKDEAVVAR
jgi:copper chaperone CopZ